MSQLVYTNEKCQGCNRCISVCPVLTANYSVQSGSGQRVEVHSENCIGCGACFDVCEHKAREYYDDTQQFFSDLARGEQISVLLAPSFQANYPKEYASVLGGLKALGVNRIISVSFGADITTWGYINYIAEHNLEGGISQPCPAVVNYIEHYAPDLIEKLIPIHSPLLCTAIYAKKYMNITDKLAFISPCIAKKVEITDPNTYGYVSYNLTFQHFMEYARKHHIAGEDAADEIEYGLGAVYPMPGGLKENVYWFCGEKAMIRQVEGEKRSYAFLKDYKKRLANGQKLPFMVDILNCDRGCLYGTGIETEKNDSEDNFYNLQKIRESCKKSSDEKDPFSLKLTPKQRLEQLNRQFSKLDIRDFMRGYTDKSKTISLREPNEKELDAIFILMNKDDQMKRSINCGACGYGNCREMAAAIYNGSNIPANCVHYMKDEVHNFSVQLKKQNAELKKAIKEEKEGEVFINQMIRAFAKSIDIKDQYTKGHSFRVAEYASMIAAKMGYSGKTLDNIYHIALLHDIGKIVIPEEILNKPGKLTTDEYEAIKKHAQYGYDILKEIDSLPNLALGAGYHHERLDGKGYPNGKHAEEIPQIARIIAVADTFDAMHSTRPYRKSMQMDTIVSELKRVAGTQLDAAIVNILLELIHDGAFEEENVVSR
ncbi:MAG: HD domain-containing protein [Bacillus sp. (in: Bacteria)]|nr:HD domain-containing protein [Bacillus sp. (in: firmicutes)]MCM1425884.1 HD domain-containing protein [Eubacterium sp.]